MKDRRSNQQEVTEQIPPELKQEAVAQLQNEINILEGWLNDLRETRDDNPESIIVRKSYKQMLQNRQELLNTLNDN